MKTVIRGGVVVLTIISLCSSVSASVFNANLSIGSRGDDVKTVQQFLIDKGFLSGVATNYFGNQTKKAIQSFQKQNSLPATGFWFTLTRKKADSLLLSTSQSNFLPSTTTAPVSTSSLRSLVVANNVNNSNKEVLLIIPMTGGGYVISTDNAITCYVNDETCKKTFPIDKKIILKAIPKEGYSFSSWSEASCGSSLECPIKLIENMTVYAHFEVTKPFKPLGKIMSPEHPKGTCIIPLGSESCDVRLTWLNNSGLDMTVKADEDEYYLFLKDDTTSSWKTSDLDPVDSAKAVAENVSGPIYFSFFQGSHKIQLKSHGQVLDTVGVDVKCADTNFWDGTKCWEKGANRLYVFKTTGVIIKSMPSGISCGYNPERCTAGFSSSTKVTLEAIVTPGYIFDGWTGDCSGKNLTCTVTMDKEKSIGVKIK